MKKNLFLILSLLLTINAVAQDTIRANQNLDKAKILIKQRAFQDKKIDSLLTNAIIIYDDAEMYDDAYSARNHLLKLLYSQGRFNEGVPKAEEMIANFTKYKVDSIHLATTLDLLGILELYRGNFLKTETCWKQKLKIQKKELKRKIEERDLKSLYEIEKTHNNLGSLYNHMKRFSNANEEYISSLKILENYYPDDSSKFTRLLFNIGTNHYNQSHLNESLSYFQKARQKAPIKNKTDLIQLGRIYNGIGGIYMDRKEFGKAIIYFKKALHQFAGFKEAYNDYVVRNKIGDVYMNIGLTYMINEDYDSTITYFKKALEYKDTTSFIQIKALYLNFGKVCALVNNLKSAKYYNEKLLKLAKEQQIDETMLFSLYNNNGYIHFLEQNKYDAIQDYLKSNSIVQEKMPTQAVVFNNLSLVYLQLSEGKLGLDSALYYIDKAIKINSLKNDLTNKDFKHLSKRTQLPSIIVKSLTIKSKIYLKYYNLNRNKIHLIESLKILELCDSLIGYFRTTMILELDKLSIGRLTTSGDIYTEAIEVCHQLYELTNDEKYIEKLYYFSERARYSVLREKLNSINFNEENDPILRGLLERKNQLEDKINGLYFELSRTTDDSEFQTFFTKLEEVQTQHFNLLEKFKSERSDYFLEKIDNYPVSISELQKALTENEGLVSYYFTSSHIYLLFIGRNKVIYRRIKFNSDDESNSIISFIEKVSNRYNLVKDIYPKALDTYNLLIKPIEEEVSSKKRITFIANHKFDVPFNALVTKKPTTPKPSFKDLNYLVDNLNISYHYSATLWYQSSNIIYDRKDNSLTLYAVDFKGIKNKELPYHEGAIKPIQEYYNKNNSQLILLENDKATKQSFISNEVNSRYLLLLTHANSNNTLPEKGYIEFLSNNLTVNEITTLKNIHSDLVFLAVCSAGQGEVQQGEGILALNRSFSYIGVPNLIYSHWDLNAFVAPIFAGKFFTNSSTELSYAKRLCDTQRYMIKKTKYNHPYFWASFTLIGQ